MTLSIPANVADYSNLAASEVYSATIIRKPLTAAISSKATAPVGGTFSVRIDFNQRILYPTPSDEDDLIVPVEDYLTKSEVAVTNGTITSFNHMVESGRSVVVLEIEPKSSFKGTITVSLPADTVRTLQGESNPAARFEIEAGTLVLALNLAAIAGDGTVNIAEKAAGFDITGDTGSESGVSVTVTLGTTQLSATSDSDGDWSVAVPANAGYITGTGVGVTVAASKTGYTSPADIERSLTIDLSAPTAPSYTAPGALKVGLALTGISPSGGSGIDSYRATGLPPGLSIDSSSGAISGTPTTANASTASVTVTVSDEAGNTAATTLTFPTVAKGDQTLSGFAYSAASVTFGNPAPTLTAPTGAKTTLSYSASPSTVCAVVGSTGALTLAGVGSCVITATAASNSNYNEATAMFTVTVTAVGTLALNLAAIAGDDTVNSAEHAAGFAITGDTGSVGGVAVTVTLGTTVLSATSDGDGNWSVAVPADADYITGTSVAVTVAAAKTGYTSPANLTRTLNIDLAAPNVPSAPRNVTATPGDASMTLSWEAPESNGGTEIIRYEIEHNALSSFGFFLVIGDKSLTATITGLSNGIEWEFRVRAVNSAGNGATAFVTATPGTVPDPPQNLTARPSSGAVLLDWDDPTSNIGLTILSYQYRFASGSSVPADTLWLDAPSRPTVIPGLKNGTEYAFEVRIENTNGFGGAASTSATPVGRPGAPRNLAASPGVGEVTLAWDEPADNGGLDVDEYEYRYAAGRPVPNDTAWISTGSARTVTVDNLTNGIVHHFEVRAINDVGAGLFQATATATPLAPPTLALNLDTIAGDGTVNIAEKAAGFDITGDTGSESGVSVTVTLGTTQLSATSDERRGLVGGGAGQCRLHHRHRCGRDGGRQQDRVHVPGRCRRVPWHY